MLKINLETELKKIGVLNAESASQEELILKEANNILSKSGEKDIEILKRLGLGTNIDAAKELIAKRKAWDKRTKNLDPEKIFTTDQIRRLCIKYRLRFLPSGYYKGTLDPLLPSKITEFERLYRHDKEVFETPVPGLSYNDYKYDSKLDRLVYTPEIKYNICAPASSFRLEQKPKDPLLFADLGDDKWYLVHKWGNDLSWSRRVLGFFTSRNIAWIMVLWCTISLCLCIYAYQPTVWFNMLTWIMIGLFAYTLSALYVEHFNDGYGSPYAWTSEHVWNSKKL